MPFVELKLCEKVGKILVEAKELYHGNNFWLIDAWMNSTIFSEILSGNEVYCSQAKSYVARCFVEEIGPCTMPQEIEIDDEILYWFGYLISYWCFSEDISPGFILHAYDLKSILDAYETLHSLSVGTAIEKIMEEYKL